MWGSERKFVFIEYCGKGKHKKIVPFFPRQQNDPPTETVDSCVNKFIEEFNETGDRVTVRMKISQTVAEMNKTILEMNKCIKDLNGFSAYIQTLPSSTKSVETESVPTSDGVVSDD